MFWNTPVLTAFCLLTPFAPAVLCPNAGTTVNLRIEGDTKTIFEGLIFTQGHDVETPSGGKHHCDGTNGGAHPTPGPTATSALDDASKHTGFDWDGTYSTQFDDYLVSTIDGVTQTRISFGACL